MFFCFLYYFRKRMRSTNSKLNIRRSKARRPPVSECLGLLVNMQSCIRMHSADGGLHWQYQKRGPRLGSHALNAVVFTLRRWPWTTAREQTVGLGHRVLATRHVGTKGTTDDSIARLPTDYYTSLRVVFQQQRSLDILKLFLMDWTEILF